MAASKDKDKAKIGEAAWARMDKVNSELLSLTYGALVAQLLRDAPSPEEASAQLERMGYNIGVRLVEEFLARSGARAAGPCRDVAETAETVAKVAFKMFLGVSATVASASAEHREFSVAFDENPLAEFAELPEALAGGARLQYSNVLCGVIRGALEMLQLRVECRFVRDVLAGADTNEIRVVVKEFMADDKPPDAE
eukprot:m51a1_g8656 hypothetical protein (196) ;mRNA; f:61525-62112